MAESNEPSGTATQINLIWHGPFHVGNFKETFFPRLDAYRGPHVYLAIQEYSQENGNILKVAYVGRANNFYVRMFQHYQCTLGLGYRLRDATGKCAYNLEDDEYFDFMDEIRNKIKLAVDEVVRIKYLCAPCDEANLRRVEAALISCLETRTEIAEGVCLKCDNGNSPRHGKNGDRILITNSAHKEFAQAKKDFECAFGQKPIYWGRSGPNPALDSC